MQEIRWSSALCATASTIANYLLPAMRELRLLPRVLVGIYLMNLNVTELHLVIVDIDFKADSQNSECRDARRNVPKLD